MYSSAQFLAIEDKIKVFDGVEMSEPRVGIDLHLTKNCVKISIFERKRGNLHFSKIFYIICRVKVNGTNTKVKPNNILFFILKDCLLLLSENVTENISKCYPFFFSFPCSTTLVVKRVLQRIRVPKEKLYILELQNSSFET